MTRLESGAVTPKLASHDLSEIIGSTLQRTSKILRNHPVRDGRQRSTGEFSNGTSGENYSGINNLEYFDRVELEFRVQAALDVGGLTEAVLLARKQEVTDWFALATALTLHLPENRDNFEENSGAYYNESQQLPR
jgi:hypothetical protein